MIRGLKSVAYVPVPRLGRNAADVPEAHRVPKTLVGQHNAACNRGFSFERFDPLIQLSRLYLSQMTVVEGQPP